MPELFNKHVMSITDFLKAAKDASTPHTEGNSTTKSAKGSDRDPKNIIVEMTSVKNVTHEEARERLLKDGYTLDDIKKMTKDEMLAKAKSSKAIVESFEESKAKLENDLEDLKQSLKDNKISSNDYQTAYTRLSKKIKLLNESVEN
jgi:hypothetical protein